MRKIIIEKDLFEKFPDFKRGLVIIKNIENHEENSRIAELLKKAIEERKDPAFLQHEYVVAWDEMHRKFGSNPNKFPPSVKALLKRVSKGGKIPFINSVVALFNYISLKYLIPCGGDDADKVEGNFRLGFAIGKEEFVPLGSQEVQRPDPGEVIYYDDKTFKVMCRKWNWRNGDFSKILPTTKRIIINVDGAENVPVSLIEEARDELAQLLREECSAVVKVELLSQERNELEIDF